MKRIFIFAALLALAACGTSPEPDFYTLAAVPGTVIPDVATVVKVRQPVIAGYLDRPALVTQHGDYDVRVNDMQRWAEPTDRMFARVLAEDLQQRLPASTIVTEGMTQPTVIRFVVDVNLQQFNATGGGHVALAGSLILGDTNTPPSAPQILSLTTNSGWSTGGSVAGLSDLTGQLADQISSQLAERMKPAPQDKH